MKASQFVDLLRKVIREEVRSVVKEELKSIKPLIAERKAVTQPKPQPQRQRPQAPARTAPIVSFDGPLGDLLNETAQQMYSQPAEEEWPDMNGGAFTAEDAPMMGLGSLLDDEDGFAQPQAARTPTRNFSGDPTAAFMKDYSGVMRSADEYQGRI